MEFVWSIVAFVGVLVFGTLQGIVVAVVLSLISLAAQVANPTVHIVGRKKGTDILRPLSADHPSDEIFPGLLILRPEGRLFFLNAQQVADKIRAAINMHEPKVIVLDLSRVFDIEYSAFQMLLEGRENVTRQGVALWLAGLNPNVLEYIRASGLAEELGREGLYHNAQSALSAYLAR
jgi:anti-anti-sigma factor